MIALVQLRNCEASFFAFMNEEAKERVLDYWNNRAKAREERKTPEQTRAEKEAEWEANRNMVYAMLGGK